MNLASLRSWALQLWLPVVIVVAIFVGTAGSTSFYFPPFTEVLKALVDAFATGGLLADVAFSMTSVAIGLAIAIVAGVGLGVLIGERESLRVASQPFLDFMRAMPKVALVPIFILTFGIGSEPKVAIIALGGLWPILWNTIAGVHGIAPSVRESVRAYRIPAWLRLWKVLIPGALPQIFAGIRIALAIALLLMIVGEIYGSPQGLGNFVLRAGNSFLIAQTWAGTLLVGLIGYAMTLLLMLVEHYALGWYRQRAPRERVEAKASSYTLAIRTVRGRKP
ncbi:ABC transporter permease [Microbacterium album]|uniref:ABC transporter permease n=1 Tax=Microbacterium album TaxID=2053191 RepID=A0A917IFG1_9MICO|nr:ABC transporter permease [Microbacterium album]GGH48432.1 ABC transporter permease [Microbacterium album]